MWEKFKQFVKNDPVVFVIAVVVVFVGFIFSQVEVLHYTSESEFCGKCHPEQKVGPLGEYYTWSKNVHADAKVECIDCHGEPGFIGYMKAKIGGLRDVYGEFFKSKEHKLEILSKAADPKYAARLVPNTICLHCHSDEINAKNRKEKVMSVGINFRLIDNVVNPRFRESFGKVDVLKDKVIAGVDPKHKTHLDKGLNCVDCHLGVAHGGNKHNLPKMETCFKCHDSMKASNKQAKSPANEDCQACHTLQKSNQQGTTIKGVDEVKWYMADLQCSDCHKSAFERPNNDVCKSCHDESYAQIMVDTQKEFVNKLAAIQKIRDDLAKQRSMMKPGQLALFNQFNLMVRVLEKDRSKGIHNPDYFNNIFDAANQLVEKIKNYKEEPKVVEKTAKVEGDKQESAKSEPAKVLKANNPKELMDMAPETINLAEQHKINATKKPVVFDHKKHAEMFECSKCHEKPEEGTLKVKITKLDGTNNSFHQEICFPCHKENKVKNGTSCTTCHK